MIARRLGGSAHFALLITMLLGAGCSTKGTAGASGQAGSAGGASGSGGKGASGGATASTGGASSSSGGGGPASTGGAYGSGGTSNGPDGASSGGATASTGGAGGTVAAGPCAEELAYSENTTIAGTATDRFTWSDAACRPRSAAMARVGGGYVRQLTYEYDGKVRTATGTGVNGHKGWGYPVSHDLTGSVAQDANGTFGPVFVGRHHAIYEYRAKWPGAEAVVVVLRWFFATGRSNPVLAITYDLTQVPANTYKADARTPYGDLAWDGDEGWQSTVVSGVGWGDRYKFITTKAPLTMNSSWDYTRPNLVPYVIEWADASDAEMGAVQTQTYLQHDAGGYWHYDNWGKTSASQSRKDGQVGLMPPTWNWTYQLNQYELCIENAACVDATTSSHRLAWGANFGAVGSTSYSAYGDDKQLTGYPYQSYSVFMVLGKHSGTPVFTQVAEIEAVQQTKLTATVGTIATEGPGGAGRTDTTALAPAGHDHVHSLWLANAAGNALTFKVVVPTGSLENPVLRLQSYTATTEPSVWLDGKQLASGTDYFVSLDAASHAAYITFHGGWAGTQSYEIK